MSRMRKPFFIFSLRRQVPHPWPMGFSREPTLTSLTRQGLQYIALKLHQQRPYTRDHQYTFSVLVALFWATFSTEIVNASAFYYTPGGNSCFQKNPYSPPSPIQYSLENSTYMQIHLKTNQAYCSREQ